MLKRGLGFHRPILYSTEYMINETVGAVNSYFENRKGEMEDIRDVEAKLSSLRGQLCQLQKQFDEKWKEYGPTVDRANDDHDAEIAERAKHLSEIEELLYRFGLGLSPFLEPSGGPFSDPVQLLGVQDQARVLIEKILETGMECMGTRSGAMPREHSLAKQLYLQEFAFGKSDSAISEGFHFVTDKLCDTMLSCCLGITIISNNR